MTIYIWSILGYQNIYSNETNTSHIYKCTHAAISNITIHIYTIYIYIWIYICIYKFSPIVNEWIAWKEKTQKICNGITRILLYIFTQYYAEKKMWQGFIFTLAKLRDYLNILDFFIVFLKKKIDEIKKGINWQLWSLVFESNISCWLTEYWQIHIF